MNKQHKYISQFQNVVSLFCLPKLSKGLNEPEKNNNNINMLLFVIHNSFFWFVNTSYIAVHVVSLIIGCSECATSKPVFAWNVYIYPCSLFMLLKEHLHVRHCCPLSLSVFWVIHFHAVSWRVFWTAVVKYLSRCTDESPPVLS